METERIREHMRAEFTVHAPSYAVPRLGAAVWPFYERLIALARIQAGQRVLDLACGTGTSTSPILERVGSAGFVLGLDLTAAMVEIAQQWAEREHIQQVAFRVIENEMQLNLAEDDFDAAICAFGLMYMPDPVKALQAMLQVLKPQGRIAVSTWASLDRCSFLDIPLHIARRHLASPLLDPYSPNPVALPTQAMLERVLAAAGLTELEIETVPFSFELETPEDCWRRVLVTGWPLVTALPSLSEEDVQALHDDAIQTLSAMFPEGRIYLAGEAIVAAGTSADETSKGILHA
ncbi:MAG: class I SAM-dependent methyltransferase [Ktedonobacteraceae bacterium]